MQTSMLIYNNSKSYIYYITNRKLYNIYIYVRTVLYMYNNLADRSILIIYLWVVVAPEFIT